MKRTAIIINKNLPFGEQANVIAIVSAALANATEDMIDSEKIIDLNGNKHAAIKNSLVILKSNPTALLTLTETVNELDSVESVVFTSKGQRLNNQFSDYKIEISTNELKNLEPVVVALYGEDEQIRTLTKKFSLLR
ncbi:hypothetical protein A5821_000276 [Enterococcus sp. 7F3_DIV0205]|uniref:DUF2000 domain-containing protein n=1 Tax=Candidatus Enterococcus palustris TaxID=1834189 RepID=A0AAQ3Y6A3_9ENTE|nr:DUF2000 family protein [Enterococcus sp. 7F3_DIV0205]OTN84689.1 hypothetical protein A5821_000618 [Enterococcus sp. 7F3_DIV0205]